MFRSDESYWYHSDFRSNFRIWWFPEETQSSIEHSPRVPCLPQVECARRLPLCRGWRNVHEVRHRQHWCGLPWTQVKGCAWRPCFIGGSTPAEREIAVPPNICRWVGNRTELWIYCHTISIMCLSFIGDVIIYVWFCGQVKSVYTFLLLFFFVFIAIAFIEIVTVYCHKHWLHHALIGIACGKGWKYFWPFIFGFCLS